MIYEKLLDFTPVDLQAILIVLFLFQIGGFQAGALQGIVHELCEGTYRGRN